MLTKTIDFWPAQPPGELLSAFRTRPNWKRVKLRRGTGRWLRVFRWVGVVLCNTRDQSRLDQRLQVGDQRLGSRLRVDLMILDVKSEYLHILRLLRGILDGSLGPLVKRVMANAFALGFSDIARE